MVPDLSLFDNGIWRKDAKDNFCELNLENINRAAFVEHILGER